MNLFLLECKANRKSLIIWCVCMMLGVLSGMAKYTAYSAGGESNQVIRDLPQSVKALLGIGTLDVTTMSGFFALLFLYIVVAAAIHSALLGSGIIAKEERDKTSEFLIVKPISRSAIITAKLLAAVLNLVILNLVTLISSIGMVGVYNKGEDITNEVVVFYLSMFLIQLIFLTFGMLISAWSKNPKGAGSVAATAVIVAYIITEITSLNDRLSILNLLCPFKYFDVNRIVAGNGLSPLIAVLTFLLSVLFAALTYYYYQKRDLNV
jgi:ABC-2 type transport system permease protein